MIIKKNYKRFCYGVVVVICYSLIIKEIIQFFANFYEQLYIFNLL
jgi:hypothetical protein